jgi:hypothetical protein
MKLSILSTVLAASQVLAVPAQVESPSLVQRADGAIVSAIKAINVQVNKLDDAITATPLVLDTVIAKSNTLLNEIQAAVATTKEQPDLAFGEAIALTDPTTALAEDTEKTINDLVGIKSQIVAADKACKTLDSLQAQFTASNKLADAITARVPAALESIAARLSSRISDAIQGGIDAYQGTCSPGSSSSSPSTPSSSATPTSSKPTVPTSSKPTVPTSSKPTVPTSSKPTVPSSSAPTMPTSSTPTIPTSTNTPPTACPTATVTSTSVSTAPPKTVTTTATTTATVTAPGSGGSGGSCESKTATETITTTATATVSTGGGECCCPPLQTVTVTAGAGGGVPCPTGGHENDDDGWWD